MSTDVLDFQVRERWAKATLLQMADLDGDTRHDKADTLLRCIQDLANSIEGAWSVFCEEMSRGMAPDFTQKMARTVLSAANVVLACLELLPDSSAAEAVWLKLTAI